MLAFSANASFMLASTSRLPLYLLKKTVTEEETNVQELCQGAFPGSGTPFLSLRRLSQ